MGIKQGVQNMNHIFINFDKELEKLKTAYEDLRERNKKLQNTLDSWNKDTEIQKCKEEKENLRLHSLHIFTDNELNEVVEFKNHHRKKCCTSPNNRYEHTFIYKLTNTHLGTAITIECPICGKSKDITDYKSW